MDPASFGGAFSVGRSVWGLLTYLTSQLNSDMISAHFKFDGSRISGSKEIDIEISYVDETEKSIYFYNVKEIEDYVFVREPVNPSAAFEILGTELGSAMPDARFWRWVAPVLPGRLYGGSSPPNVKVDFLVFGYRPKALLGRAKPKAK